MPVTDSEKVNVFGRRVLGYVDFSTRLLDMLEDSILRHTKIRTTGPAPLDTPDPGGWFTSVAIQDGGGSNDLTLVGGDGGVYGTDGTGEILSIENGDDRITDVPFPDAAATTYYVASRSCLVPTGIQTDTQTGAKNYDYHRREMGQLEEPSAVATAGLGIQFTLGNHKLHASDDFTGRTAIVYLKSPVSGSPAVAIETVTISGTTATTTGALGQSVVSTTASDYEVIIVGPTITRFALTNLSTGWAFIGTVVGGGAPRTFDMGDQAELVSLEDLSAYANRTQKRGWLGTLPTVTNTATTISITTAGELVVNGRLRVTGTAGPFGSLAATSDIWVSWDDATGDFAVYTSWDTAFAAGRVPLVWAKTDGASNITNIVVIGRLIEEYPETMTITVATDSAARAEYQSLKMAIAAARSYQKGSTIKPRAVVIEIIGDVTVSAAISETELFEAEYITFRGRGRRFGGGGARLIWTHTTGGLFVLNGAAIALKGWAFEDITFRCAGTMTDAKGGVFSVRSATSFNDLAFRNCVVDGSTLLVSAGGAGGSLPCFLYIESAGTFGTVLIEDCTISTTDALLYATAASGGLVDLTVRGTSYVAFGTVVGSVEGGLVDLSSSPARWRVEGCQITSRAGPTIYVDKLNGGRIRGNKLERSSSADGPCVQLGDTSYSGIANIWLTENEISAVRSGGDLTTPVVRVRAGDSGGNPPGIFIHSNLISGDGETTACIGIRVSTDATDLHGVIIHSNTVIKVGTGISFTTVGGSDTVPLVYGNYVVAGTTGLFVGTGSADLIALGNHLEATQNSGICADVNVSATLVGNLLATTNALVVSLDIDADDCTIVGNRAQQDITLTGSRNTLIGNATGDAFAVSGTSQKNLVIGLGVGGTVDLTTFEQSILSASYLVGTVTPPNSTHGDSILDGVYIEDTNNLDFLHDRGTISGCIIKATGFSLNTSSSDLAVVGNHLTDTTPTDGGTNNVLNDNT